jgi:hypothetical protein
MISNSIENGIAEAADFAGYIPEVCFFSGLTRAIYGVAKVIFNSFKANFSENEDEIYKFQNEKEKGWEHITSGVVEALHLGILFWCIFRI